jgi:adenylosuccinate synthase
MKKAIACIGANYGDCGKGLIVDYLASQLAGDKVCVRFNGGAQAGHTVISPSGERHVFSHFGSGTFSNSATYLAKHFVCNPILFWKEAKKLATLGFKPLVAVDPRCYITTPYDMIINQMLEDSRGDKRHGSVGVGFGETIERNKYPTFKFWREDLNFEDKTIQIVRNIRDHWIPNRLRQLKLPALSKNDPRLSKDVLSNFIYECLAFSQYTKIAGAEFLLGKSVIFEGAQGLALDMERGEFPHVTRSNTGLKNVIPIAKAINLQIEAIYVSRTYLTRHGAGPLSGEYTPVKPILDDTNTLHPYQGELRFAPLDIDALKKRIKDDVSLSPGVSSSIALTCLDQVDDTLITKLKKALSPRLTSRGPKRIDVIRI